MKIKKIEYYTRQHLQRYYPDIIEEVKQKILNIQNQIEFIEDAHEYFLEIEGIRTKLNSASKIYKRWIKYTDFTKVAKGYAWKNGLEAEEVLEEWHLKGITATNYGTKSHQFGEIMAYIYLGLYGTKNFPVFDSCKHQFQEGYFLPNGPKEKAIVKFWNYVEEEGDIPVLVEARVRSLIYKYCGTFDGLFYSVKRNGFIIRDYKTNEYLEKEFKKPMLPPFQDYNDEPLSHYTIQTNLYQIPLEDLGIDIIDRELIWLKDDGEYEIIRTKNEIDKLKIALAN